jgi:hypothetical protein
MDDPARVSRRQRIGDANGDPQHLVEAHAVPRNELIHAFSTHILHHDEIVAVSRFDLMNRDDVRVIEGRGGVCFLDKPAAAVRVADAIGRQYLDSHLTIQSRIASPIYLAHPTCADEREDFVRPECRAGLEGHVSVFGGIIRRWRPDQRERISEDAGRVAVPSLSNIFSCQELATLMAVRRLLLARAVETGGTLAVHLVHIAVHLPGAHRTDLRCRQFRDRCCHISHVFNRQKNEPAELATG